MEFKRIYAGGMQAALICTSYQGRHTISKVTTHFERHYNDEKAARYNNSTKIQNAGLLAAPLNCSH